jgi:DNA-binding transcriptional LysR family regulator
VTCAPTLGTEKIIVALPEFLARYPDVEVELRLSDGYVDLIAEGVDMAFVAACSRTALAGAPCRYV